MVPDKFIAWHAGVSCWKNHKNLNTKSIGIEIQNSELQRIPLNTKKLSSDEAINVIKLLDLLEENDDVQQVFHNMELTDEILQAMEN